MASTLLDAANAALSNLNAAGRLKENILVKLAPDLELASSRVLVESHPDIYRITIDVPKRDHTPSPAVRGAVLDLTSVGKPADLLESLVSSFSAALLAKLRKSAAKYGYEHNPWQRDDWADELRAELRKHVEKGDPSDVAAYCAFAWHHGWSLANQPKPPPSREELFTLLARFYALANEAEGADGPDNALAFIEAEAAEMLLRADAEYTYPEWFEGAAE